MTTRTILFTALQPQSRLLLFAVAVLIACILPSSNGRLTTPVAALSLLGIVIAIGHGAFDGVLARPLLRLRFGRSWYVVFLTSYLAGIFFVVLLWFFLPAVALCAFLAYSAWHFGTESLGERITTRSSVLGWSAGFVPIAAACQWHPHSVTPIFALMMSSGSLHAAALVHLCSLFLLPCIAITVLGNLMLSAHGSMCIALSVLELVLFWRCDPLVAFAVFFCLWHTPEHLVSTSTSSVGKLSLRKMSLQLRSGLLPWMASLAAIAVLFSFGARRFEVYAAQIFILLSALTLPHMTLNELRRHSNRRVFQSGEAYAR